MDKEETRVEVEAKELSLWELRKLAWQEHVADGKSEKHAWYLAYQQYPKQS